MLSLTFADGDQFIIAATFADGFVPTSSLYGSSDGGRTFENIDMKINGEQVQIGNGLQKHPRANKVFVITRGLPSGLYVTVDGGMTFGKKIDMPFVFPSEFLFHPHDEQTMLALSSSDLWLSKDDGKTWKKVQERVHTAKWSPPEVEDTALYASTKLETKSKAQEMFESLFGIVSESFDNNLQISRDFGETWQTIHTHMYKFGIQGHFLFVSVFLNINQMEDGGRTLEVSRDEGKRWDEVQLPTITSEQFYAILEMSEDMIFLHVDTPGDTGEGTLYTSDKTGIIFSESLNRHFYPNYHDLTDFYKVESLRGVYTTSQLDKDESIHTLITYDRGGEWVPIKRPEGARCEDEHKPCHLQIHNQFSKANGVDMNVPISSANAPGLVMVHGHVADNTKLKAPSVFVSGDGGYTWKKALDGPHHYQIADQGALLVAVPKNKPHVIKYSTDEGECWTEHEFTQQNISFQGLLVDPKNTGHSVSVWGSINKHWSIHTFDFSTLITATCVMSDYEAWYPHFDMGVTDPEHKGCLFGHKEKLYKLSKSAWCLIMKTRSIMTEIEKTPCTCTRADYDCDYGYHRTGRDEKCVEDKIFKGPHLDICMRGHEYEIITEGYRRIPGDMCTPTGKSPITHANRKEIDLKKVCKENADRLLLESLVQDKYLLQSKTKGEKFRTVGKGFLIFVCVAILLMALIGALYFTRKRIRRHRIGSYRYASVPPASGYGTDEHRSVAHFTPLYDDESDEDTAASFSKNTPTTNTTSPAHFPPINAPTVTANQPPSVTDTDAPLDLGTPGQGGGRRATSHAYHDDSDVDLLI